tara:strand:+ start:642 stop:1082 length:441 start_codon:yes stop_codon:yes gene_type:complete
VRRGALENGSVEKTPAGYPLLDEKKSRPFSRPFETHVLSHALASSELVDCVFTNWYFVAFTVGRAEAELRSPPIGIVDKKNFVVTREAVLVLSIVTLLPSRPFCANVRAEGKEFGRGRVRGERAICVKEANEARYAEGVWGAGAAR